MTNRSGDSPNLDRSGFLRLLLIVWFVFIGIVFVRLIQLQVFLSGYYRDVAATFQLKEETIPGIRGEIYDSKGRCLATNHPARDIYAEPGKIKNKRRVASVLSRLGVPTSKRDLLHKLNAHKERVLLASMIDFGTAGRIMNKKLEGIDEEERIIRYYPWKESVAHLVGFVGMDRKGLSGMEKRMQDILAGTPGKVKIAVGKRRETIGPVRKYYVEPSRGSDVILTIDTELQSKAYSALEKAVKGSGAKGGSIVALNPATGEIKVVCSYPSYDPNHFRKSKVSDRKFRAVIDNFEPGSAYKIVAVAAALEENLVSPEDSIFCENGLWAMPVGRSGKTYRLRDDHKFGNLTVSDCIAHSSNIGVSKIAGLLGSERLYEYSRKFGFGLTTGCGIDGESSGTLHPVNEWSAVSLSRLAIGQEILVTTMQLANAYSIIASGGLCMQPFIIKGVRDSEGNWLSYREPRQMRQSFLSPEVCREMTSMLEEVVENGTGKSAAVPGVRVAGKTGTAEIMDKSISPNHDKYNAVFAGFTIDVEPPLVVVVNVNVIDRKKEHYGGSVAAPVFREVVGEYTRNLNIERNKRKDDVLPNNKTVPAFRGMTVKAARDLADRAGIRCGVLGKGERVVSQSVPTGTPLGVEDIVFYTSRPDTNFVVVPDCRNITVRDAMDRLTAAGLTVDIVKGAGLVEKQIPSPGDTVPVMDECELICSMQGLER